MKRGNRILVTLAVAVALLFAVGVSTLASSGYGSQSDPLVTLSYLKNVFEPGIMDQLNQQLESRSTELVKEFSSLAVGADLPVQSGFTVLSITEGQTLECSVGTEIMLRVGTAVSTGSESPRLVDETGGAELDASGAELEKNHMYIVTIAGNGIKATTPTVKVLIRGSYTVSP